MDNKKVVWWVVGIVVVLGLIWALMGNAGESGEAAVAKAFDQYGYNETARLFQGKADGVDRNLDGTVWGDATYANDKLVMKWNEAWDACNDAGNADPAACGGAWLDNEWNGAAGGSKEVWHYKIIWVGPSGEGSQYWQPGGYLIWGNYEVLMDQGVTLAGGPVHTVITKSTPNGYGAK
jgi:hypothetical protein